MLRAVRNRKLPVEFRWIVRCSCSPTIHSPSPHLGTGDLNESMQNQVAQGSYAQGKHSLSDAGAENLGTCTEQHDEPRLKSETGSTSTPTQQLPLPVRTVPIHHTFSLLCVMKK